MVEGLVPHGNAKVMAGFLGCKKKKKSTMERETFIV
jgi:hypothetical protein